MRGGNHSVSNHKAGQYALNSVRAAREEVKSLPKGKVAEMLAALQKGSSRRRRQKRRTMKKMH